MNEGVARALGVLAGGLAAILLLVAALLLYFLPAIVASRRKHHNEGAIAVLNLFLGWTALGWILALVWANTEVRSPPALPSPAPVPVPRMRDEDDVPVYEIPANPPKRPRGK